MTNNPYANIRESVERLVAERKEAAAQRQKLIDRFFEPFNRIVTIQLNLLSQALSWEIKSVDNRYPVVWHIRFNDDKSRDRRGDGLLSVYLVKPTTDEAYGLEDLDLTGEFPASRFKITILRGDPGRPSHSSYVFSKDTSEQAFIAALHNAIVDFYAFEGN
ncbi:MAG: hypothetical protein ACOYZ8_00790 [Chloroflexota bacterium]